MARARAPMDILLGTARDDYVAAFRTRLRQMERDLRQISREPLLRDEAGDVLRMNVLNLPARADLMMEQLHERSCIDLAVRPKVADWRPEVISNGPVESIVSPFSWGAMELRFAFDGDLGGMKRLRNWYMEWFLPRRLEETPDLTGAVHRITGPSREDDLWRLEVDMGTAPVAAGRGLIDALVGSGVRHVAIGMPATADLYGRY